MMTRANRGMGEKIQRGDKDVKKYDTCPPITLLLPITILVPLFSDRGQGCQEILYLSHYFVLLIIPYSN